MSGGERRERKWYGQGQGVERVQSLKNIQIENEGKRFHKASLRQLNSYKVVHSELDFCGTMK